MLGPILWHLWQCKRCWIWPILIQWKMTCRREYQTNCTWRIHLKQISNGKYSLFLSTRIIYIISFWRGFIPLSSNFLGFLNALGAVEVGLESLAFCIDDTFLIPEFLFCFQYPQLFTGILSPWKGLLLYGPPGMESFVPYPFVYHCFWFCPMDKSSMLIRSNVLMKKMFCNVK